VLTRSGGRRARPSAAPHGPPEPARSSYARVVTFAVIAGFLARAAFGLVYWTGKPLTHDEREYLALAANIWQGRGFTHALPLEPAASVQQFGRAPLYPLFLAPLTAADADLRAGRLPPDVPVAVKVTQAIVGALGVWLIALIARRAAGARAGAAAAIVAAVYPPLVWMCAYALSEAMYSTLALACVWVLGVVVDRGVGEFERDRSSTPHPGPLPASGERGPGPHLRTVVVGAGLVAGLAALTRPGILFFLPLAGALLAFRAATWRIGLTRAALFGGAAALVIAPWTIRNASAYGRFVPIASEGGITFWTGNHREAAGEGDLAANPRLKELNLAFRAAHPGLTEEELEPLYYREALHFIAEDPGRWIRLLGRKLFHTVIPTGPSYRLHSTRYQLASSLSYALLLPFAMVGAWRLGRAVPLTLVALALSSVVMCLVFFPQERFRIPVFDPTLIVLAAGCVRRS
jgi:hypothetical protein